MKWVLLAAAMAGAPLLSACSPAFHDIGYPAPMSDPHINQYTTQMIAPPAPAVIRYEDRREMASNSLWSGDYVRLFRDKRAYREGDILTVRISMNDRADFENVSERETEAGGGIVGAGTFDAFHMNPSASIDAEINLKGSAQRGGSINRAERIRLSVAAVVIRASPNGNLVIAGTQEVRLNHELRLLTVEGVVRASDILPDNTIPYEKIAEARISYGGSNTRHRRPPWLRKLVPHPRNHEPQVSQKPEEAMGYHEPRKLIPIPKS